MRALRAVIIIENLYCCCWSKSAMDYNGLHHWFWSAFQYHL